MKQHPYPRRTTRATPLRNTLILGLALLFTACSTVARPSLEELETQNVSGLLVSTSSDRSNPVGLGESTLSGQVYIFTQRQGGVKKVNFYLDNPEKKNGAFATTTTQPWDFMGTAKDGTALPFDTGTLENGEHELFAVMHLTNGQFLPVRTTFMVTNKSVATVGEDAILVSPGTDRKAVSLLDGATISGDVYISSKREAGIKTVAFYINDPNQFMPYRVEREAPYNFAFDTTEFADGVYVFQAGVTLVTGETKLLISTATIKNGSNVKQSNAPANPLNPQAVVNAHYGPLTNPTIPAKTVQINPGDNIQAIVSKNRPDTTFVFKAGVYRLTTPIAPKEGNTFIGEYGTIISGARLLTSFQREGGYWVATDQTQEGPVLGNAEDRCLADKPSCKHPEQFFIDDVLLRQVLSLSEVKPGYFYFDYNADKIYFQDNPDGKKVETSVAEGVFRYRIHNVTVKNLIVEKFANPAQRPALGATGDHWIIENNTARFNHGPGIGTNNHATIRGNYVHHNGQLGIGGQGSNGLVEANEIAYNNIAGFNPDWEAGGTKFVRTHNLILRRNYVHHNAGYGLWGDVFNKNMTFEYNVTNDNLKSGLMYEISDHATIRYNTTERNGGQGIMVSNSPNTEVYGNYVNNNLNGIIVRQYKRGSTDVYNTSVHDNIIIQKGAQSWIEGLAAGLIVGPNQPGDSWYSSKNNRFQNNTYHLIKGANLYWQGKVHTPQQWQSYEQDTSGTFTVQD